MIRQILVCLVVISAVWQCALAHHLRHHNNAGEAKSSQPEASAVEASSSKNRRSLQFYHRNGSDADRGKMMPYSYKKLDKMMNKAILQIILGDLHPADMLLLKALNYTLEDVMTIRKHELSRLKEEEALQAREKKLKEQELLSTKYQASSMHRRSSSHQHKKLNRESSIESYNKQAVYDYENGLSAAAAAAAATIAAKLDYEDSRAREDAEKSGSAVTEESLHQKMDRAMESHVVFKVRHDDSEFDSGSDERAKRILKNHRAKTILKIKKPIDSGAESTFQNVEGDDGHVRATALSATIDSNFETDEATRTSDLEEYDKQSSYENLVVKQSSSHEDLNGSTPVDLSNETNGASFRPFDEEAATTTSTLAADKKRVSEYEGLEWVGGDIYRVVPEAMDTFLNYEDETQTDYENKEEEDYTIRQASTFSDDLVNDTFEYQNDAAESALADLAGNITDSQNLTSAQRLALAQRRDGNLTTVFDSQGQKAIEDIKLRVLALTGRFNQTPSSNQVQQRLTMFRPSCQVPRNTDPEAWSDPYSMNMHFQLNLTPGEHVRAAKLRLFQLPQDVTTSPSSSTYEEDEEDEKKIRVSVYLYTKSLKKHRAAKKRLMDSIVTSLTSQGSHLVLDVRQAPRFWRPGGGGNHGLLVLVEDQDGRPLQPANYIREPSCQPATTTGDVDEKTSASQPFSSELVVVTVGGS